MEVLKERCCEQLSGLLASATFQSQVIALGLLSPVRLEVGKGSAAMAHAAALPKRPGTGRGQQRDLHGPKPGLRVTLAISREPKWKTTRTTKGPAASMAIEGQRTSLLCCGDSPHHHLFALLFVLLTCFLMLGLFTSEMLLLFKRNTPHK